MSVTFSTIVLTCLPYICVVVEFFSLCYLFYALCLRNSPVRQPYFVISILCYIIDFTTNFSVIVAYDSKFENVIFWHDLFLFGISGLVLAFNRFTAIVCWKYYSRIWSVVTTSGWCLFLLMYPVIVNIGFIASDPNGFKCLPTPTLNEKCRKVYARIELRQCVSSVITIIGSVIFNAMTVIKVRKTSAPEIATKLFIQSCVSNGLFVLLTIAMALHSFMWPHKKTTSYTTTMTVVYLIRNLLLYCRQCVNILWLVAICRLMLRARLKNTVVLPTVASSTT